MSDYTPTTEEVREATAEMLGWDLPDPEEAFDRWLAGVRREAAAEALIEFADYYKDLYAYSEIDLKTATAAYWSGAEHAVEHFTARLRTRAETYRREGGE